MPIAVQAIFSKATTIVDGSWRVSFDLSEQSSEEVTEIAAMKEQALYLVVMSEQEYNDAHGKSKVEKNRNGRT